MGIGSSTEFIVPIAETVTKPLHTQLCALMDAHVTQKYGTYRFSQDVLR